MATPESSQNPKELLEKWLKQLGEAQFSHYEAAKHRESASRYGAVRRRFADIFALNSGNPISNEEIKLVRKEIDTVSSEAPDVPDKIWQVIQERDSKG